MDELRQSVNEEVRRDSTSEKKKEYEKPAVIFERPLEALAAACSGGKTAALACSPPINS